MAQEKYSNTSGMAGLGLILAGALEGEQGGDGDTGAMFPRTDAEDMSKGARFIPGMVTLARRAGQKVNFVTECGPNCWYWEMPDGTRIYHFDVATYEQIGATNRRAVIKDTYGMRFQGGPGPCPHCGNVNTRGGIVKP